MFYTVCICVKKSGHATFVMLSLSCNLPASFPSHPCLSQILSDEHHPGSFHLLFYENCEYGHTTLFTLFSTYYILYIFKFSLFLWVNHWIIHSTTQFRNETNLFSFWANKWIIHLTDLVKNTDSVTNSRNTSSGVVMILLCLYLEQCLLTMKK